MYETETLEFNCPIYSDEWCLKVSHSSLKPEDQLNCPHCSDTEAARQVSCADQQETSSEVFLVKVEAEMFTLSFDDFSQSWSAAVKHVDLSFVLLRHFLKNLAQSMHIFTVPTHNEYL